MIERAGLRHGASWTELLAPDRSLTRKMALHWSAGGKIVVEMITWPTLVHARCVGGWVTALAQIQSGQIVLAGDSKVYRQGYKAVAIGLC